MSSSSGSSGSGPGFKLDIGCVERDEDRADFLSACSRLDLRAIRDLVEGKGVEAATARDAIGQNCLHFVVGSPEAGERAAERQEQLLGYLTSLGADPNAARSTDGWTPIFLAVVFRRPRLVTALLSNGADAALKDGEGRSPEDWADRYRVHDVKDLLLHSRNKVGRSRFSCVQQGPAPEATAQTTTDDSNKAPSPSASASTDAETPSSPPSSSSADAPPAVDSAAGAATSEEDEAAAALAAASLDGKEAGEKPLLAAQ